MDEPDAGELTMDGGPLDVPPGMDAGSDTPPGMDASWGPCTYMGTPGDCLPTALCPSASSMSVRGLCPGPADIQCCVPRVDAPPTGCHAMLDSLGLDWSVAGATRGIADPVIVQPVIEGVRFRYVSNTEPTAMLMDCELAPRLVELARLVSTYGIDEVIHIGIYNYRCIGGGDPDVDGCTPSQHAYARAIDLHAFGLAGSDVEYSTETDFEITMSGDDCPLTPYASTADQVLKELACSMWSESIFQIVLTPNYNAAHRNHFHVDLTEGSMFLGSTAAGVDPAATMLGD